MAETRSPQPLSSGASVVGAVFEQGKAHPDSIALSDNDVQMTYAQLRDQVDAVANWIHETAPASGPVGLLMDNSVEAVVFILSCLRLDRTVIPINTKNNAETVRHIVNNSGVGLLVLPPQKSIETAEQDYGVSVAELTRNAWPRPPHAPGPLDCDATKNAIVFYTSGSTGKPKGVAVTQSNLAHGADSVAQYLGVKHGQRIGAVLPISFDAGLNWVLTGLTVGAEVHLLRYVFPKSLANDLSRHKIEALLAVPTVFFALSSVAPPDGHKVSLMASTGGRMDASIVEKLRASYSGLEFVVMYGLTEAFRATYLPDELWETNRTSIGVPIPHAAINILREDGTEADVDEPGEIVQSGPLVSNGYLNSPAAMKERFGPCPRTSPYAGSYPVAVYSGDYGSRDQNGLLYFVGRKDRLIKSRGFRISPEEIEKAVSTQCGYERVVVFGRDDLTVGQRIVVVIEAEAEKALGLDAIRAALRPHVAGYMLPDEVHALAKFPLNTNGKFDVVKIVDTFI